MKTSGLLGESSRKALSPLESRVLRRLSSARRTMTVREIHGELSEGVALTSVAVILDRLHKMGLVDRRAEACQGGIRYHYTARASPREFERAVVQSTVDRLIAKFGPTALAYFEERFGRRLEPDRSQDPGFEGSRRRWRRR